METETGRFLRLPELMAIVGLRRSALYSRISDGCMPPPCHLGRAAVWPAEEVAAWMRRVRDSGEPPVGTFPPRTLGQYPAV